ARREILLSAAPATAGEVAFVVGDSGPGFAPEIVSRLFQPFATTKDSGMGLGLSISLTIIEAHGGHIEAEAGAEGGARLRFTLPAATASTGRDDENA
ncbi:MAG: histidine kinase, partial [Rhodospirillaceae bacterium]|nr:histidine kinase [Rhodospirillaceae bacterium]